MTTTGDEHAGLARTASGETWHGIKVRGYLSQKPTGLPEPSSQHFDVVDFHWSTGPKDALRLVAIDDLQSLSTQLSDTAKREAESPLFRPQGGPGDAIDFACDHAGEPVFFLEDWRAGRADEWPEYMHWLKVQQDGAALKGTDHVQG